ncbi:MAG: LysR family transcriptional regulator [Lachnospiraceae bacterium]
MTLRHFRIFITVYSEKSMTAAAKKLYMTQPSISQAIKELETYYEVILFERFPQKLFPTQAGEKLYGYASHILEKFAELEDSMKAGSTQRLLRIGSNDTVGSSLLNDYIKTFLLKHPEEEIQVTINKSSVLTEMIRTNDLDFILTDEFKDASDITSIIFGEDDFIVAASHLHPLSTKKTVTLKDLSETHLLLREPGTRARDCFETIMNANGFHITPYWESISFDILVNAILKNVGIAILPHEFIKSSLENGELVQLHVKEIHYSRQLVVAYQKNKYISPQMCDFFAICQNT